MNVLFKLDIFGSNFNFYNFKERQYHTLAGLILSLLCYGLVAAFITIFGRDLFDKTNPNVIIQQIKPKNDTIITLSPHRFTFAWRLQDSHYNPVDITGFLYPRISYIRLVKDPKTKRMKTAYNKTFSPTRCSSLKRVDPEFKRQNIPEEWYCLDMETHNFTLGGYYGEDTTRFLAIDIFYCPENNHKSPNCTPLKTLKQKINKLFFSYILPDYFFDPKNLTHPLQYLYLNQFSEISTNLLFLNHLFLKEAECLDDQNLVLSQVKEFEQTSFHQREAFYEFKSNAQLNDVTEDTKIYGADIFYSRQKTIYIRKFMKLQDLAATVGGFMNIIFLFGQILIAHINEYQRNIDLINQLFDYTDVTVLKKLSTFNKNMEGNSPPKTTEVIELNLNVQENNKTEQISPDEEEKSKHTSNNKNKKKEFKGNRHFNRLTKKSDKNEETDEKQEVTFESDLNKKNFPPETDPHNNQNIRHNNPRIDEENSNKKFRRNLNALKKFSIKSNKMDLIKIQHLLSRRHSEYLIYDEHQNKEILENLGKVEKRLSENKRSFNYSIFLNFKRLLCKCCLSKDEIEKTVMFDFAKKTIEEKLDIVSYMKIFSDIQKLHLFLYNDCQNISLDFLKKPNLKDSEDLKLFDIDLNKEEDDKSLRDKRNIKLVQYYVDKLRHEAFDDVDKKLFELLMLHYKEMIVDLAQK